MTRLFKLTTGEFVVTEIKETREDGGYVLNYPLVIVPIPQQQQQVGFAKFMPFSNTDKSIVLFPSSIMVDSKPDNKMNAAYEQQVSHLKAQESGIIIPNSNNIPSDVMKDAAAQDFSNLRT